MQNPVLPANLVLPVAQAPAEGAAPQGAPAAPGAPAAVAAPVTVTAATTDNGWKRLCQALILFIVVGFLIGTIRTVNSRREFRISDSLDHQGPWYRQMTMSVWDYSVPKREYEMRQDFLGCKTVVYHVGSRKFIQTESGQPAIELYPAASKSK